MFIKKRACTTESATASNCQFEEEICRFLHNWISDHPDRLLLKFDQPLKEYIANNALRDFFLHTQHPLSELLKNRAIARHLRRHAGRVYFDPITGDPLLAAAEQRIYNLARRIDHERMHVPFRSVHPNKQTEAGDNADIATYDIESEIRYNSGNHFVSRPANGNVFDENSRRCTARSEGNLHVLFKRGFLEERLHEVKAITKTLQLCGQRQPQFFVICSRHSQKEGHFGAALVIMDPANPDFPQRVIVCDTLLKDLPHHPRWWLHFVEEFSNVFGNAITEIIADLSHPLQKVNIKGDDPYRHDWDCPYYVASMANALVDLVKNDPQLLLDGTPGDIYNSMKDMMPDYYHPDREIKDRPGIQQINRLKRWKSGRILIRALGAEVGHKSPYEI